MKGTADQIPAYATGAAPANEEPKPAPRAVAHRALKGVISFAAGFTQIDCPGSLCQLIYDDASATGRACAECHAPFQPDGTPDGPELGIIR